MNSSVTWASAISVMSSLCLRDQPEQQVERALEDVEVHLERRADAAPGDHPARGEGDSAAADASSASVAAAASAIGSGRPAAGDELAGELPVGLGAAACVEAYVVIGSAASVASGNFTVRLMTVWNTWSPKWSTTLRDDLAAVQGAAVVHRGQDAVDLPGAG